MKNIVSLSIIIVFIWLSNFNFVLGAQFSQGSTVTPFKYLAKFASDQPTLQQRVVKRQTSAPTPEDGAICDAQLNDVVCTAGIHQSVVELGLSCIMFYSSIEEAQYDANFCAKHEGGQFCGSLWERYRIRSNYIEGNCSRVLTTNSCPSNCRSLLEDFRSTLGCCINAYVNDSGLYLYYYSGSTGLDYRVWNLCDVPLPPAACGNGPTINPPANVQNCTAEDYFNEYYTENFCLPEQRQAYIDVLESSICRDVDSETASYIKDVCSVDANGVPCGILYYRSLKDLARLDLSCANSNVSCTSNCRDGITAAKKRYGCCFRSVWFNISSTAASLYPSYLSSSVLRSCDIDLPGACEGLIGSAVSTMKTKFNYISLIVTGLMCLILMMIP